MIELAIPLTPPQNGSPAAEMSPTKFLVSAETLLSLKRKASLPEISSAQAKHLRLDPPPISDDIMITHYHERTADLIDRSSLQVMIPFEQAWRKTQDRLKVLEEQLHEERRQRLVYEEKVNQQERLLNEERRERLMLLIGNAIIDMAKLIFQNNRSVVEDPSTNRLQQLAANVTDKQLKESQIPTKYWPHIRSLPKVCEEFYFIYCLLTIV